MELVISSLNLRKRIWGRKKDFAHTITHEGMSKNLASSRLGIMISTKNLSKRRANNKQTSKCCKFNAWTYWLTPGSYFKQYI